MDRLGSNNAGTIKQGTVIWVEIPDFIRYAGHGSPPTIYQPYEVIKITPTLQIKARPQEGDGSEVTFKNSGGTSWYYPSGTGDRSKYPYIAGPEDNVAELYAKWREREARKKEARDQHEREKEAAAEEKRKKQAQMEQDAILANSAVTPQEIPNSDGLFHMTVKNRHGIKFEIIFKLTPMEEYDFSTGKRVNGLRLQAGYYNEERGIGGGFGSLSTFSLIKETNIQDALPEAVKRLATQVW